MSVILCILLFVSVQGTAVRNLLAYYPPLSKSRQAYYDLDTNTYVVNNDEITYQCLQTNPASKSPTLTEACQRMLINIQWIHLVQQLRQMDDVAIVDRLSVAPNLPPSIIEFQMSLHGVELLHWWTILFRFLRDDNLPNLQHLDVLGKHRIGCLELPEMLAICSRLSLQQLPSKLNNLRTLKIQWSAMRVFISLAQERGFTLGMHNIERLTVVWDERIKEDDIETTLGRILQPNVGTFEVYSDVALGYTMFVRRRDYVLRHLQHPVDQLLLSQQEKQDLQSESREMRYEMALTYEERNRNQRFVDEAVIAVGSGRSFRLSIPYDVRNLRGVVFPPIVSTIEFSNLPHLKEQVAMALQGFTSTADQLTLKINEMDFTWELFAGLLFEGILPKNLGNFYITGNPDMTGEMPEYIRCIIDSKQTLPDNMIIRRN